jgi:hypothetical protein
LGLRFRFAAVALVLCLGCGSSGSEDASGAAGSSNTGGSAGRGTGSDAASDADVSGYPPGPYGNAQGEVLADLELDGYLRHESSGLAYQASFGRVRLSDVRTSAPTAYALIHISGFT